MQRDISSSTAPGPAAEGPTLDGSAHELVQQLAANISQVFLGKEEVVRLCVVALLAGEHILLEDVPGVGKTLLARAIAHSLDGRLCRIQFTPDMLPSDIVGSTIFNAKSNEFTFSAGPVFANVVLADEINRTTPRTQSALLEAMSEGQVSIDGTTHALPEPFIVIATQNPFEFEGTYPLPENQLDRFLLRTRIGYPSREDERRVLASHRDGEPVEQLKPVINCAQVAALQRTTREVRVDEAIEGYILDIIEATRECDDLHVGVSTRGLLSLYRASQALAVTHGRDYVVPDDVKQLVVPVLAHRVISRSYRHAGERDVLEALVRRLADAVPVPG
jgi:MoxR-like ATPase